MWPSLGFSALHGQESHALANGPHHDCMSQSSMTGISQHVLRHELAHSAGLHTCHTLIVGG
jgi:hypothetical protein